MEFLRELLNEGTNKSKKLKKASAAVYHRDYQRTKDENYRQYDPKDYKRKKRRGDK